MDDVHRPTERVRYGKKMTHTIPSRSLRNLDKHLVSFTDPDSYQAEGYRGLRYLIEERRRAGEALVVGICSPAAGDGKSLTALNLAGALSQDPALRVLLMDVDLRRRSESLRRNLGLRGAVDVGLMEAVLDTRLSLRDVAVSITQFNLTVVGTGEAAAPPYEVLRSQRFGELIAAARSSYDFVILDAPPVVPVSDCRIIAKWVDHFVMVVAAHRTPRAMLDEALNLLGPEKLLGIVFNRSDLPPSRYYGYYGYDAHYGKRRSGPRRTAASGGERMATRSNLFMKIGLSMLRR